MVSSNCNEEEAAAKKLLLGSDVTGFPDVYQHKLTRHYVNEHYANFIGKLCKTVISWTLWCFEKN